MKVRVTLMTENNVPVSELGENPEQKIREVWDAAIALIDLTSEDSIYVEKIELVEAEQKDVGDMVSRRYLLTEYDRQHQGPPGGARKIIEEAPSVQPKIEEKLGFLEFLWNVINPNEMEQYLSMYHCGEEKIDG